MATYRCNSFFNCPSTFLNGSGNVCDQNLNAAYNFPGPHRVWFQWQTKKNKLTWIKKLLGSDCISRAHCAIWGKLGTALQAYTLDPCTKFPPYSTSRKDNTFVFLDIDSYELLYLCFWCFFLNIYRHTCYCSSSAEKLTLKCWLKWDLGETWYRGSGHMPEELCQVSPKSHGGVLA